LGVSISAVELTERTEGHEYEQAELHDREQASASAIDAGLNERYAVWNEAIGRRYFTARSRRRPVYLSLDDGELRELGSELGVSPSDAASSFAASVCEEFRPGQWGGAYQRFTRAAQVWRKAGCSGYPPFLGLLGLAVLAASRMAASADQGILATNYYRRYNQLIGDDRRGRPPGYTSTRELWRDLSRWLDVDLDGRYGLSTITEPTTQRDTYIGYAISQCLLREADRNRLSHFFTAVGLEPGTEVDERQLLTLLRNWARAGTGFSAQGFRVIHSDELAPYVTAIVAAEFERWDGLERDEAGRRSGQIALVVGISRGGHLITTSLFPSQGEGFPEGHWDVISGAGAGGTADLRSLGAGWFQRLDEVAPASAIVEGIKLRHGDFVLAYVPAPIVPLREDRELPGWASVRQITASEPHGILCSPDFQQQTLDFLEQHADPGWRVLPASTALPEDWTLVERVVVPGPVPGIKGPLARLAPQSGVAPRLSGGLRVARGQYLHGGEPDVLLPPELGTAQVVVDGRSYNAVGLLKLAELGLRTGEHTVTVGGVTRRFITFDGFPAAVSGTGSLGYVFKKPTRHVLEYPEPVEIPAASPPRGTIYVSGAFVAGASEDLPRLPEVPILLRSGFASHDVLGAAVGDVRHVSDPPQRQWLRALKLSQQFFDQPLPFEPQWLVIHGGIGIRVRPLRDPPLSPVSTKGERPPDSGDEHPNVLDWARTILSAAQAPPVNEIEHEAVWGEYVRAAEAILADA
jgi:hypothetical protein